MQRILVNPKTVDKFIDTIERNGCTVVNIEYYGSSIKVIYRCREDEKVFHNKGSAFGT